MKLTIDEMKSFVRQDAINCSFELGWTLSRIQILCGDAWRLFQDASIEPNPLKFKQQLFNTLMDKCNRISGLNIKESDIKKLTIELNKLLTCSLASNRTPDEIFIALKTDDEMRTEVFDLILSRTKYQSSMDQLGILLTQIFTDDELRVLMNKQQEKKNFPHNL